jgi:hypothetical protein
MPDFQTELRAEGHLVDTLDSGDGVSGTGTGRSP